MARCPVCGKALNWGGLVEQMLEREDAEEVIKNRKKFVEAVENFVFRCPHCGEEFYGKYLPREEVEKVFELLNEFKGSIDWENKRVRLRLNSLLALDKMLENWDKKMVGR